MMQADLGALVCVLRARQPVTINAHMGNAAQQLLLAQVSMVNPDLTAELDAPSNQSKPYAVSGLLVPERTKPLRGKLRAGAEGWLRLVGLRADVVEALEAFRQRQPSAVEFDRQPWELVSVSWDGSQHPWAGITALQVVQAELRESPAPSELSVQFASPTLFRRDGLTLPFPIPERIFGSLINKLETYTGVEPPDDLKLYVRYFVQLTHHELYTYNPKLEAGKSETGFMGRATFTMQRSNSNLRKKDRDLHDRLLADQDLYKRILSMLIHVGFYTGVGARATKGLGMMREIPDGERGRSA